MLKLDNTLLDEIGLGSLSEEQKKAMLQHIYETLELRVGTDLANQMTDQQLEEFEKFIDDGGEANQAQALQWLEANLPNYKDVVNRVFEELKAEIKNMAPQILASSAAAPAQQAGMPQAAPAGYVQSAPADQSPYVQSGAPAPGAMPMGQGQSPAPGYAQPNVSVQPQPLSQYQPAMSGAPQQDYYQQPYQQGAPAGYPAQGQYGPQPMPTQPYQPVQPGQQFTQPSDSTQPGAQQGQGSPFPDQQPPAGPGATA